MINARLSLLLNIKVQTKKLSTLYKAVIKKNEENYITILGNANKQKILFKYRFRNTDTKPNKMKNKPELHGANNRKNILCTCPLNEKTVFS